MFNIQKYMEKIMNLKFLIRGYEVKNHSAHFDKEGSVKNQISVPIILLPSSGWDGGMYDKRNLYFTTWVESGDNNFVKYKVKKL